MDDYDIEELLEKVNDIIVTMSDDEPRFHVALEFAQQLQDALQEALND